MKKYKLTLKTWLEIGYLKFREIFLNKQRFKDWCNNSNFFFIISIGRSGTKFLSKLLNYGKDTYVHHEPFAADYINYFNYFTKKSFQKHYTTKQRPLLMFLFYHLHDNYNRYGEVNSLLRRQVKELKKIFPQADFFHLIRNPYDTVRSMYSRGTLSNNDPVFQILKAKKYYPETDSTITFQKLDRFERLCWYWREENNYLDQYISQKLIFNRCIDDYEYLQDMLLEKINIKLSKNNWLNLKDQKVNKTSNYDLPEYSEWSEHKKQTIKKICSPLWDRWKQ